MGLIKWIKKELEISTSSFKRRQSEPPINFNPNITRNEEYLKALARFNAWRTKQRTIESENFKTPDCCSSTHQQDHINIISEKFLDKIPDRITEEDEITTDSVQQKSQQSNRRNSSAQNLNQSSSPNDINIYEEIPIVHNNNNNNNNNIINKITSINNSSHNRRNSDAGGSKISITKGDKSVPVKEKSSEKKKRGRKFPKIKDIYEKKITKCTDVPPPNILRSPPPEFFRSNSNPFANVRTPEKTYQAERTLESTEPTASYDQTKRTIIDMNSQNNNSYTHDHTKTGQHGLNYSKSSGSVNRSILKSKKTNHRKRNKTVQIVCSGTTKSKPIPEDLLTSQLQQQYIEQSHSLLLNEENAIDSNIGKCTNDPFCCANNDNNEVYSMRYNYSPSYQSVVNKHGEIVEYALPYVEHNADRTDILANNPEVIEQMNSVQQVVVGNRFAETTTGHKAENSLFADIERCEHVVDENFRFLNDKSTKPSQLYDNDFELEPDTERLLEREPELCDHIIDNIEDVLQMFAEPVQPTANNTNTINTIVTDLDKSESSKLDNTDELYKELNSLKKWTAKIKDDQCIQIALNDNIDIITQRMDNRGIMTCHKSDINLRITELHNSIRTPFDYKAGTFRKTPISIKSISRQTDNKIDTNALMHDLKLLNKIKHINIALLMAICLNEDNILTSIIMEPFKCTLNTLIYKNDKYLPINDCFNYTQQIIDATIYVHECGIIHSNISSHNILVCENKKCVKLSSFELATEISNNIKNEIYEWYIQNNNNNTHINSKNKNNNNNDDNRIGSLYQNSNEVNKFILYANKNDKKGKIQNDNIIKNSKLNTTNNNIPNKYLPYHVLYRKLFAKYFYQAPELFERNYDFIFPTVQTDIYGISLLFWEMLNKCTPYAIFSHDEMEKLFCLKQAQLPIFDKKRCKPFEQILQKGLSIRADNRYKNALALKLSFDKIQNNYDSSQYQNSENSNLSTNEEKGNHFSIPNVDEVKSLYQPPRIVDEIRKPNNNDNDCINMKEQSLVDFSTYLSPKASGPIIYERTSTVKKRKYRKICNIYDTFPKFKIDNKNDESVMVQKTNEMPKRGMDDGVKLHQDVEKLPEINMNYNDESFVMHTLDNILDAQSDMSTDRNKREKAHSTNNSYHFKIDDFSLPDTPIARKNKIRKNAWLANMPVSVDDNCKNCHRSKEFIDGNENSYGNSNQNSFILANSSVTTTTNDNANVSNFSISDKLNANIFNNNCTQNSPVTKKLSVSIKIIHKSQNIETDGVYSSSPKTNEHQITPIDSPKVISLISYWNSLSPSNFKINDNIEALIQKHFIKKISKPIDIDNEIRQNGNKGTETKQNNIDQHENIHYAHLDDIGPHGKKKFAMKNMNTCREDNDNLVHERTNSTHYENESVNYSLIGKCSNEFIEKSLSVKPNYDFENMLWKREKEKCQRIMERNGVVTPRRKTIKETVDIFETINKTDGRLTKKFNNKYEQKRHELFIQTEKYGKTDNDNENNNNGQQNNSYIENNRQTLDTDSNNDKILNIENKNENTKNHNQNQNTHISNNSGNENGYNSDNTNDNLIKISKLNVTLNNVLANNVNNKANDNSRNSKNFNMIVKLSEQDEREQNKEEQTIPFKNEDFNFSNINLSAIKSTDNSNASNWNCNCGNAVRKTKLRKSNRRATLPFDNRTTISQPITIDDDSNNVTQNDQNLAKLTCVNCESKIFLVDEANDLDKSLVQEMLMTSSNNSQISDIDVASLLARRCQILTTSSPQLEAKSTEDLYIDDDFDEGVVNLGANIKLSVDESNLFDSYDFDILPVDIYNEESKQS